MPNLPFKTFKTLILFKPLSFLLILVLSMIGQNGKILSQVIIGKEISPSVIVNQNFISGLGFTPNIPQIFKEKVNPPKDIQAFPLSPLLTLPQSIVHKNKLKNESPLPIQINAYAKILGKSKSELRRLSLSRTLAVRSLFIEQGIKSSRINVSAWGGIQTTNQKIGSNYNS